MYAVVMTHSFDSYGNSTVLFENEDKARAYLRWSWEMYFNTEVEEGSQLCYPECYCNVNFAKVTWDDGEFTEFTLMTVQEAEEEFEKCDWHKFLEKGDR